jgi:uncharacterized membrane protein YdjX (TVP38/TMEM64 family)
MTQQDPMARQDPMTQQDPMARQDPMAEQDPRSRRASRRLERLASPLVRAAVLVPLLAVAVVLSLRAEGFGLEAARTAADGAGLLGPLVFAAAYAVGATILLPAAPFTIGAGLLFGPVVGSVTALVGATAGATGGFLLGRLLGRDAVERFGGTRVTALDRSLSERGFAAVLLIRLVPLFPFNLINVVAGVTGIRLRPYVVATALGIVPGTVAYAALGGTIDDPTSPAFLVAVLVFVVVTLVAVLTARRLREREVVDTTV